MHLVLSTETVVYLSGHACTHARILVCICVVGSCSLRVSRHFRLKMFSTALIDDEASFYDMCITTTKYSCLKMTAVTTLSSHTRDQASVLTHRDSVMCAIYVRFNPVAIAAQADFVNVWGR